MVSKLADQLCIPEYCGIYHASAAVCDSRCSRMLYLLSDPSGVFAGEIFYRTCSGRIYYASDRDAVYRKCSDDEPWDHRLLYCQDL